MMDADYLPCLPQFAGFYFEICFAFVVGTALMVLTTLLILILSFLHQHRQQKAERTRVESSVNRPSCPSRDGGGQGGPLNDISSSIIHHPLSTLSTSHHPASPLLSSTSSTSSTSSIAPYHHPSSASSASSTSSTTLELLSLQSRPLLLCFIFTIYYLFMFAFRLWMKLHNADMLSSMAAVAQCLCSSAMKVNAGVASENASVVDWTRLMNHNVTDAAECLSSLHRPLPWLFRIHSICASTNLIILFLLFFCRWKSIRIWWLMWRLRRVCISLEEEVSEVDDDGGDVQVCMDDG